MKVKHTDFGTIIEFTPEEHQLCMMILGIAADVIQDCDPESAITLNQVVDSIEQIESLVGHA